MSTPARERSGFHSAFDMAEWIRSGVTLHDTAKAFGLSKTATRGRLNTGGWSWRTGQPLGTFSEPEVKPPQPSFLFIDQPWANQALCAQTDPDAFFPEDGGSTRNAKAVCVGCPVRAECLDYALTTKQRFGVWGGRSERERRAISNGTTTTCPDCGDTFYSHSGYLSHQRTHLTP